MDIEFTRKPNSASASKESHELAKRLTATQLYKEYEQAFNEATGLPLAIRPLESFQSVTSGKRNENPFCSLMSKTNKSCAACLRMQASLEEKSHMEPQTLSCFAGLCDTMVPIRVGEKIIAFLQTGQILLHQPNKEEFSKTTQALLSWGAQVDLKSLEEAYYQTKVLDPKQYEAFVNLLAIFAKHLANISNSLILNSQKHESETIIKARKYIEENFDEQISLDDAAQTVNTSVRYFCKVFKKATGFTFTDYLSRVRIEKAKNLLLNPHRRISEVAFEVGFESLSQFNRSFKRLNGKTPTEYRNSKQLDRAIAV